MAKRSVAVCLLMVLFLLPGGGCASPEAWVIVSVRDRLDRRPIEEPVVTVAPRAGSLGSPTAEVSRQANAYGTARVRLATGQTKYRVTVDAPGYDLFTFDLPNLDGFFPSGRWLRGENARRYQLRPDNELELMVTIEPGGE
ncbi:MAG: hypothetical protein AAF710_01895 [Planctomycetota bacterium]